MNQPRPIRNGSGGAETSSKSMGDLFAHRVRHYAMLKEERTKRNAYSPSGRLAILVRRHSRGDNIANASTSIRHSQYQ